MVSEQPKAEAKKAYEAAKKGKAKEKAEILRKSFFKHKDSNISDNQEMIDENIANLILEEDWDELNKNEKKNKIESIVRKKELENTDLNKMNQSKKKRIIKGLFNQEVWQDEENLKSLNKHLGGSQINGFLEQAQNKDMKIEDLKRGLKKILNISKAEEAEERVDLPEISFDNSKNIEDILTDDFINNIATKYLNLAAKEAGYKDVEIKKQDAEDYLLEFKGVLETNLEENFEEGKISEEGKNRLLDLAEGKVAYIRKSKENTSNKDKAA